MYDLTAVLLKEIQDPSLICVGSQMSAATEWDNRGELSSSVRELETPACVRCVCDLVSKLLFQHMESRKHFRPAKLVAVSLQDLPTTNMA